MNKRSAPVALALCAVFLLGVLAGRLSVFRGAAVIRGEAGEIADGRPARLSPPTETDEGAATKVNINTARADELDELPGIGPALAGRIVEYREQNGPFLSPEELKAVKGIGEQLYQKVSNLITIN